MGISYDDFLDFFYNNKVKIIVGICLLVILIIMIVYLSIDRSHSVIYNKQKGFYDDEQILVGFEKMPPSEENIRYTLSTFIRLNNLSGNSNFNDFTQKKIIIDNGGSPNLVYYPNTGVLDVEIAYKDKTGVNDTYNFNLEKMPLQKWVGICVVVDGKIVKVYIDGYLHTAKKLDTVPWKSRKMLSIGKDEHNFNGNIGMIDYYSRSLNETEVKKLYKKRIRSLPDEVLTYEQMEYKKRISKEMENQLNKIKMI